MDQQRFDLLKKKYDSALLAVKQQGVELVHLHEDNGKLIIVGKAPSDAAKNRVWDKIKEADPRYSDVKADITVDPSMAGGKVSTLTPSGDDGSLTYTVKAGDTLSKISQQFYGDAMQYMRIAEANRDQIDDPNKIQPGMKLQIPTREKQPARQ